MFKNTSTLLYSFSFTSHGVISIIGGGTAGINIAAHLIRSKVRASNIRIFDPAKYHYYQPGFTMVGANITRSEVTRREMKEVLPEGVKQVAEEVVKIDPAKNSLITSGGKTFTYENLIVAAGFKIDWNKIENLQNLLEDENSNVVSIYDYHHSQKTGKVGKRFKGGNAIFTEPVLPIKCAGAPQKILYLMTDIWQKAGLNPKVEYIKNGGVMFGVPKYSESLKTIAANYGINVTFKHDLVSVTNDTATFESIETKERIEKKFDYLHVTPPMSPPTFLAESGIANEAGFVDVDKFKLRHKKYPNIWSLGDCSSLPNSKTAAAIFSQTTPLLNNLLASIEKPSIAMDELPESYDGYASCPLFTSNSELMLAEFKYDGEISETFFKDQEKPREIFYIMKKSFFPEVYWRCVPLGLWNGRKGFRLY